MAIDWGKVRVKHDELVQALSNPAMLAEQRHKAQKQLAEMANLLSKYDTVQALEKELALLAIQLAAPENAELKELFEQEAQQLEQDRVQAQRVLEAVLYPPDELDDRSVFVEIRSGTGGQEAALFAADLMKVYSNYALRRGWQVSVSDASTTDLGGFREVVLHIQGKNVYEQLKHESGVHRVQRVPATETAGRIHTSTATVAVLPEAQEVDVVISPNDLRIDVYRSGGAGGQSVNTTDSAVRITHIPTGTVVTCQDERSQHKNKAKAMKILTSRILAAEKEKHDAQMSKNRKDQVGTGVRSEKIRTYNYPQNRITDHRIELTLKKLDMIMQGDLDEIVEALVEYARQHRAPRDFSFLQ